ncbi:chymotrypsin-like elastase family member 1, partial [Polypterus senegalus]|uniref:chymotrypsin-like elastase family member 1 n=1 Tax=Polypterus senegalus TaxID=55291 RepID=UPI0019664CDF
PRSCSTQPTLHGSFTDTNNQRHIDLWRSTDRSQLCSDCCPLQRRLEHSVTLTPGVQIIGIPKKRSSTLDGTSCSVAGWGTTDNNGPTSTKLMEVNVTIQDVNTCTAAKIYDLKETVICARGDGIKGTCSGDSGGPLVCSVNGRKPKAVGIVSFHLANSKRCKDPNRDNIYTKVSVFRDWIDRNIKANSPA